MANIPLINGRAYSHTSLQFKIKGVTYLEVKELKYSDNLEPGEVEGTAAQVLGRTLGKYKCEASVTVTRYTGNLIQAALGKGFMAVPFDIVAGYKDDGMPLIVDTIRGCRIKKNDTSSSGSDPNELTFDLHPMYILWNGVNPFPGLLLG